AEVRVVAALIVAPDGDLRALLGEEGALALHEGAAHALELGAAREGADGEVLEGVVVGHGFAELETGDDVEARDGIDTADGNVLARGIADNLTENGFDGHALGVLEELGGGDLGAVRAADLRIAGERAKGGADDGDDEVGAREAEAPEGGDALVNDGG